MATSEHQIQAGRTPIGLWWSLVAGFAAWAFDLGCSYVLEQHSCSTGHHYVLHVISIVSFAIALTGFGTGLVEFRRFPVPHRKKVVAISIVRTFRRFWEWPSVFALPWWSLRAPSRDGFLVRVNEMSLKCSRLVAMGAAAILSATPCWALTETGRLLANDWTWPPFIAISLVLTAALYGIGVTRMRRRVTHRRSLLWQTLYFALGWISLVIALDSPLHELGEELFWVHMTQHEILMLISAPLLVLGQPLVAFLWALPPSWRDMAATFAREKAIRTLWASFSAPVSAWLLSALALWVWHIPWLFDQTLRSNWIHAAQHTTFLVSAIIFWWPLANRISAIGYGGGLAYVFTTILHTSVLGALLTFAPRPWYSSYIKTAPAWGLTALEDQQLGGLIMWIPAGTLLLIVALFLLVKWMNESQTRWQYTRMAELGRLSERGVK